MNPPFTFIPLADVPRYLETISAWVHADRQHSYPRETLSGTIQVFRDRCNTDRIPLSLVALAGDQPAGTISLVKDDAPPGFSSLSPWMASMVVASPFRGQGLEVNLMNQIFSHARSLGYAEIYAWTDDDKTWYHQQGWTIAGTTIFGRRYVGVFRFDLTV